jgi:hypothetical protein
MLHHADVVHIEDVDLRQAKPLQTVLERAHDPIVGIVVDGVERHRMPTLPGLGRSQARAKQTSDFRRQHPFVTWYPAHRIPDATLGLAETVIGRRIDIADSSRPGRVYDGFGLLAADLDAATAKCRAAQSQRRDFK